jgi:hypothetical protein
MYKAGFMIKGFGTKNLLLRVPLLTTICTYFFLIISSRPTADEYLAAPVLQGYYVDRPKEALFNPSEFFPTRYLQGVHAMVKLGWDAWLNSFTFQMGTGVLTNYFGPAATIIQGILFAALVVWSCFVITDFLVVDARSKSAVYCTFVLGLMLAVSAANFNTPRMNFGLYTFLGIRFSIYLVHALLFLALVVKFLKSEKCETSRALGKTLVIVSLFCGMVSLWYVFYLFLFVICTIIAKAIRRQRQRFYWAMLFGLIAATYVFHDGLKGAKGRTTAATRSPFGIVKGFTEDVLLNRQSRIFRFELWNTVLGRQSIIGFGVGFLLVALTGKYMVWRIKNLKQLTIYLAPSVCCLPIVFAFQEYITYEAWWHRTTPIVFSFFLFLLLGCLSATKVPPLRYRKAKFSVSAVMLIIVSSISLSPFIEGLRSIDKYRSDWDNGNILGIGSPLENDADYNVINAFRVAPYTNQKWDVQARMIQMVQVVVRPLDGEGLEIKEESAEQSSLIIETAASPFDTELAGMLTYRLKITDLSGAGGNFSISDGKGRKDYLMKSGKGQITEIHGMIKQPGNITLTRQTSKERSFDLKVVEFGLGFSSSLRERFGIDQKIFINKST